MKKFTIVTIFVLFVLSISYAQNVENPWEQNFPDGLLNSVQEEVSIESLDGKIVGIYFSASWCRGCVAFSRILVPFRNRHIENFEVVLAGFDHSTVEMHDYMQKSKMLWPAIPYESPARIAIKERFGVSDIPALIIMAPDGSVITEDGYQQVDLMGDEALQHWLEMAEQMQ
jgi:nucleoredoxin